MKKIILLVSICVLIVLSIILGFYINFNIKNINEGTKSNIVLAYDNQITSSNLGKTLSPNAKIFFKKMFNECNHEVIEEEEISEGLVNLSEQEIKEIYVDWEVKEFDINEMTLYKEIDGFCENHYILKLKDDFIAIYNRKRSGEEELMDITEISKQYLTRRRYRRIIKWNRSVWK